MFCTSCGAPLEDNAKFCTSCGARVENAAAPATATAPATAPVAPAPAPATAPTVPAPKPTSPAPAAPAPMAAAAPAATAPHTPAAVPTAPVSPQPASPALSGIAELLKTGDNLKHIAAATALWGFGLMIAAVAWIAIIAPYHPEDLSAPIIIAAIAMYVGIAVTAVGVIGYVASFVVTRRGVR